MSSGKGAGSRAEVFRRELPGGGIERVFADGSTEIIPGKPSRPLLHPEELRFASNYFGGPKKLFANAEELRLKILRERGGAGDGGGGNRSGAGGAGDGGGGGNRSGAGGVEAVASELFTGLTTGPSVGMRPGYNISRFAKNLDKQFANTGQEINPYSNEAVGPPDPATSVFITKQLAQLRAKDMANRQTDNERIKIINEYLYHLKALPFFGIDPRDEYMKIMKAVLKSESSIPRNIDDGEIEDYDDIYIPITDDEYRSLAAFIKFGSQVVDTDTIAQHLWPDDIKDRLQRLELLTLHDLYKRAAAAAPSIAAAAAARLGGAAAAAAPSAAYAAAAPSGEAAAHEAAYAAYEHAKAEGKSHDFALAYGTAYGTKIKEGKSHAYADAYANAYAASKQSGHPDKDANAYANLYATKIEEGKSHKFAAAYITAYIASKQSGHPDEVANLNGNLFATQIEKGHTPEYADMYIRSYARIAGAKKGKTHAYLDAYASTYAFDTVQMGMTNEEASKSAEKAVAGHGGGFRKHRKTRSTRKHKKHHKRTKRTRHNRSRSRR